MGTSVLKVLMILRVSGSIILAPSFEQVMIKACSLATEKEWSLSSWILAVLTMFPIFEI